MERGHEDAKDVESDVAYGTYDGIANMHDSEAVVPLGVDLSDAEPSQTCQHGTSYRLMHDCPSCVALCDYQDRLSNKTWVIQNQQTLPVNEETALVVEKKQRKRVRNVALVKRVAPLTEIKTQATLPENFDDIAPSERSPAAASTLPPAPPPLPLPAPPTTDIVSVG